MFGNPTNWVDPLGLASQSKEEFEPVELPENDKGCSGWCFHVEATKVAGVTIDSMKWREVGGGCPYVLKWGASKNDLIKELKKKITPTRSFDVDRCSEGCECGGKKDYSGKKISIVLKGQEIELDPADFVWPANNFKKGECFIQLTGKIELEVGKGWIGRCCKKK